MNRAFIKTSLCVLLSTITLSTYSQKLISYVNPFIGTAAHGHTFPGATVPFGMVQLSPDTGTEGWDWCSGYHSSDSSIIGFSHTHLSGTGGGDYGDILLMPTIGAWKVQPGAKDKSNDGYRSRFSHETEKASPGYYSVFLDDYKITAELTTTTRVGIHKYIFPKSSVSNVVVDLEHGISDDVRESFIQISGNDEVVGLRRSKGWANDQYVYFIIKFSKPFKKFAVANDEDMTVDGRKMEGTAVKGIFRFTTKENEAILVKVAISSVSVEGARKNLEAEAPEWDFEKIRAQTENSWEQQLSKIKVNAPVDSLDSSQVKQKTIFYTSLYHCFIHPNIYSDVDGQYRGMDMQIHKTTTNHYTVFSLWDTFRALHPLFTLIAPERNTEMVQSLLDDYKQSGRLPIWELASNETGTMIGYHAVPVIADMILKGIGSLDVSLAYEAMKKSALDDDRGLKYYKLNGFIPRELEANSVSKQLEYTFDDWCISQVALKLGKQNDYEYFLGRALNYRNVFDPSVGFMRGRNSYGQWNPDFNPMQVSIFGSGDFTEGNAWQYSFFAPQDVNGMMELYGGAKKFAAKLDSLFAQKSLVDNEHALDVSGLIGQYAHGNEPSHHVAYLYNYAAEPWKTQQKVHEIRDGLYSIERAGLCGNEDCGQMSAWYVFSALGFYPVNPASGQYILGSPLFESVTLNPDSETSFTISANDVFEDNIYVEGTLLNNQPYSKTYVTHKDLVKGGAFVFSMVNQPNHSRGTKPEDCPVQAINVSQKQGEKLMFKPYEASGKTIFFGKKLITLKSETQGAKIYYTVDGTVPTSSSKIYTKPFEVNKSVIVNAVAIDKDGNQSEPSTINFTRAIVKTSKGSFPKIKSNVTPGNTYKNTADILLDGTLGSYDFRDGKWFATDNGQLSLTIELEKPIAIKKLNIRFMENTGSWIFIPKSIRFKVSADGSNYVDLGTIKNEMPLTHPEIVIKEFSKENNAKEKVKFIKIEVENAGKLPGWHPGAGNIAWMFMDELTIEY
ncbi:GH92 family glycosyl hydrolase [Solitalea lacus]|uniref:GH92 family glycosyl hydrolase n=1 Tax=Solitalea lacus TaxID=2911172 RepID=UPI001EDB9E7D|nr:GH92 family glycosyl hydrolase [Solitalea lacus]UKJ08049.1 GH92 family glycosyl hydrolase [Solitalea lacus]